MASENHRELSQFIKEVHSTLRKQSSKLGTKKAWHEHCSNQNVLLKYAKCMEKLATTHWENNCNNSASEASSRIKWAVNFCLHYFTNITFLKYSEKELEISQKINIDVNSNEIFSKPLKLLDVGSCYNPFQTYDIFDVLAIDLCPANSTVWQCDFLNVPLGFENIINKSTVQELQENSFEIVTFCFLLEYIPSSELRIKACEKAYRLLKCGGVLIINTPDSKHVGANCKIMKCWRYTLAQIGFSRIKYEKFKHMHCMAFRKSLHKQIAARWATIHKEPYMEYAIHIPQDFNQQDEIHSTPIDIKSIADDFIELPFCKISMNQIIKSAR